MLRTRFTELVGCTVPIQQAAMGPEIATPRLAGAIADAGGLGMVSVDGLDPRVIRRLLADLAAQTTGVFGANLILKFVEPELHADTIDAAAVGAALVELFFSAPDEEIVKRIHAQGALAAWQVGSRAEALAAVDAGCDLLVVQGVEAGGHLRGTISLLALLGQVLDAVDVPVVAAGGIGSGRAMAAALAAGADGVRVGTRLLAATESGVHPRYLEALCAAAADDTVYTTEFAVGWPDAPHRVLRSALAAARAFDGEVTGDTVHPITGDRRSLARFDFDPPTAATTGAVDAMCLYAGESVDSVQREMPAGEIIAELVSEAASLLGRWGTALRP